MISLYARKTLSTLRKLKKCSLEILAEKADLTLDQLRKAVEELKSEGLVEEEVKQIKKIRAGNKLKQLKYKLPERILVNTINLLGGEVQIDKAIYKSGLAKDDALAAIGKALEKGWIEAVEKDGKKFLKTTGKEKKTNIDEVIIAKIGEREVLVNEFTDQEKKALKKLLKRPNLIETYIHKDRVVKISEKGLEKSGTLTLVETVSNLTSKLIKTGLWRKVLFEKYDLNVKSYPLYPGRRHPLKEMIEEIREIFVSMGFEEIEEPLIQLAFWNFDALFQPQDHPARDMQDTFYLEYPNKGEIGGYELIQRIKKTHEDGWITGSIGWGGEWSLEEARKLVLRTHTTVATVKDVYRCGNRPRKAFIVGNVFRNEKMDYKHSAEFYQVDGIVIDKNANIRQLMGILKEFYKRLGLRRVRFIPSFFPYTEPSIQTSVYIEKLNDWIELAGMGIFRPEVTKPLGVDWPVLAWGCGVERLVMIKYDVDDIRELYRGDLGWLRSRPVRKYLW